MLVTNPELEEEDLGPLKNISKRKLCDGVGKQTNRGTMSDSIHSLGGHRHFAKNNYSKLSIFLVQITHHQIYHANYVKIKLHRVLGNV